LIATGLIQRATRDVDIVALANQDGGLVDPAPLPSPLVTAAAWTQTHDTSAGYLECLRSFLKEFGYANLVDRI